MTRHLTPVPDNTTTPRTDPTPPHDTTAEMATLGAALLSTHARTQIANIITAEDFYDLRHELIWHAITTLIAHGTPIDAITIGDHLTNTGDLERAGGQAYLHQVIDACPVPATGPTYATIVTGHAQARAELATAHELARLALTPGPDARAAALTLHQHALDTHPTTTGPTPQPLDQFLATTDDDYDWLIEGFLERGDRCIVTAPEGTGKSTLLRQWGVQLAAGIHPFTLTPTTPGRVLILDLENSERQTRRALRPLSLAAGTIDPTNLLILCKPDGLDLTNPIDVAWLDQLLTTTNPDLLITGPIYKLAGGNPNDEKDAKPAALAIDGLRARHGCTVLLEAHTKKGENAASKNRAKEPFGWSGWMRWPEIGIHIDTDGELTHWRGLRDASRLTSIPMQLHRGGPWPWTATTTDMGDTPKFLLIENACRTAGKILTQRDIAAKTGLDKSTVYRVLKKYSARFDALRIELDATPLEGGDGW